MKKFGLALFLVGALFVAGCDSGLFNCKKNCDVVAESESQKCCCVGEDAGSVANDEDSGK